LRVPIKHSKNEYGLLSASYDMWGRQTLMLKGDRFTMELEIMPWNPVAVMHAAKYFAALPKRSVLIALWDC